MIIHIECTDIDDAIDKLDDLRADIERGDLVLDPVEDGSVVYTPFGSIELV